MPDRPTFRPVYKALHRPLTIWGVDRRLFFLALLLGAATFNLFYSFLAGLVMFGMVATTGARIVSAVDFKNYRYNLFVVAISVGFGLIPLAAPNFFRNLPHDLQPLLESGILLCALVAVMLNAFFNGVGSKAAAEADAAAVASSAQHV